MRLAPLSAGGEAWASLLAIQRVSREGDARVQSVLLHMLR